MLCSSSFSPAEDAAKDLRSSGSHAGLWQITGTPGVRVRVRVGVRVRVRVRVRLRVRLRLRVTPTGHPGRDLVVALAVEEQDGHQVGVVERGVDRHARHHEVVGAAEGRGAEDPLELARLRG